MKTPALATIYLDNEAVGLMGDPKPRVSKVVAGGKKPEAVRVLRAASPDDTRGKPVQLEDTIDRTAEPTKPIYLTSSPRPVNAPVARNSPVMTRKVPPVQADAPKGAQWATWPESRDGEKLRRSKTRPADSIDRDL